MPTPQRHALLSVNRYLLPVAVTVALLLALLAAGWLRLAGLGAALAFGLAAVALRGRRPQLWVDDDGYAVLVAGQPRFRVAWTQVTRVLHDPSERALYLDCGDPAHNLLLPPITGFAFTFERRDDLYRRLLTHVGDRAEVVDRFDRLR